MDERVRSTGPVATAAAARKTIQRIAHSAVPALADFVLVFIVAGRSIVSVASAHTSPAGARVLRSLQRVYRVRRDDLQSTVAQVVRTGRPSLRREIARESPSSVAHGSIADLHRQLACRSALVLPIRVGPTVTGAVSLCYAESGRSYAPRDLAGAQRVATELSALSPSPHAANRLRAPAGHARGHAAVRRRVVPRN